MRAFPSLLLIVALSTTASAENSLPTEAPFDEPPLSKKAAAWLSKGDSFVDEQRQREHTKRLQARLGKPPARVVNIYNTWTHETLAFTAEGAEQIAPETVNHFLRCHFTNEPATMDPALFGVLLKAAKRFAVDRIHIVSGYRHDKYNLMLRKKGRQVARTSQHTLGHAVDFRLPGVAIGRLHRWARSLRLGGVGFYRSSGFIHVDTGDIRFWNGR